MIDVHVCDTSSNEGMIARNNLKRIKLGHVITFAPMSNGVTVMVNKVVAEAEQSPTGMIKKLAIWAHGGPGAAGSQFLTLLANAIWEVPVYAGEVEQAVVVGGSGLELAWTGTVHVAKPGMTGTSTFQGAIRR